MTLPVQGSTPRGVAPPGDNADLLGQLGQLRAELAELRRRTAYSETISKGGLTVQGGGFVKVIDEFGVTRLYFGKQTYGGGDQVVFNLLDQNGHSRFGLYDFNMLDGYAPAVLIFDHLNHVAFSTDQNGGVAEPHVPVPMLQRFRDSSPTDTANSDPTLPVSALVSATVCFEGRISKASHPRIGIDGSWGRVTGSSGTPTYSLWINGVQVTGASWTQTAYGPTYQGPWDVSALLGQTNLSVQLKVSATGTGTDRVAVAPYACYLRQT